MNANLWGGGVHVAKDSPNPRLPIDTFSIRQVLWLGKFSAMESPMAEPVVLEALPIIATASLSRPHLYVAPGPVEPADSPTFETVQEETKWLIRECGFRL